VARSHDYYWKVVLSTKRYDRIYEIDTCLLQNAARPYYGLSYSVVSVDLEWPSGFKVISPIANLSKCDFSTAMQQLIIVVNGMTVSFSRSSLNQSINQNLFSKYTVTEKLQCNKCCSTWKATRKALCSLKLVAWNKTNTIHQKRTRQEEKVTSTRAISVQIQVHKNFIIHNNDKSSLHTPWFLNYIGSQLSGSYFQGWWLFCVLVSSNLLDQFSAAVNSREAGFHSNQASRWLAAARFWAICVLA